jgi:hypothetical protein
MRRIESAEAMVCYPSPSRAGQSKRRKGVLCSGLQFFAEAPCGGQAPANAAPQQKSNVLLS